MSTIATKTCSHSNTEVQRTEGGPHYGRRTCADCGRFLRGRASDRRMATVDMDSKSDLRKSLPIATFMPTVKAETSVNALTSKGAIPR
jgi:hypothetical protein